MTCKNADSGCNYPESECGQPGACMRPAAPIVSHVLHKSAHYEACLIKAGLTVQSRRTGAGRLLAIKHPQFADYLDGIKTAIDTDEADALCRALMT